MATKSESQQEPNTKVADFVNPTQNAATAEQTERWQAANKSWWENAPMRYDWREKIDAEPGSENYFNQIDSRFFGEVWRYMPWENTPFDSLINFHALTTKDVLEIGVGHGSHAQLISKHCKHFTGIDLTERAVSMTSQRLLQKNIEAKILQMDAEKLAFEDNTFDFVWSWGVIHHSANTEKILSQIKRVLKPDGHAIVMVYHRSFWKYFVMDGFMNGVLRGQLLRRKSFHKISQSQTDGAIARYYTISEWRDLCGKFFETNEISICGQKADLLPIPAGKFKNFIARIIPDALTRFFTNNIKMGSFLISKLGKK